MRTIAVLNQKGGVGKTTTTVNLAAALAAAGKKVIAIDLDPQAHLTIHFGMEPQKVEGGSYEVLTQSADLEQSLLLIRPNLWLLAANINLVGAETELVSVVGREIILKEALQGSEDEFDYCLMDCAPSLGLLSLNALAAAQEVLIPLQPHFLALQGFGQLLQTVDLVNKRINRDLKVSGVLLCMFDTRASLPNEVRADIERFLESARGSNSAWAEAQVLPTFIRRNIKLAEAPSYGMTIFEYDPTCNGAADYKRVACFFMGIDPEAEAEAEPEPEIEADVEAEPVVTPEPVAESEAPLEPEAPPEMDAEPEESPHVSRTDAEGGTELVPESEAAGRAPESESEPEPEVQSEGGPAPESESVAESEVASEPEAETIEPPHAPIQIREVGLPAPRQYSPQPIQVYPAEAASEPVEPEAPNDGPALPDVPEVRQDFESFEPEATEPFEGYTGF